DRSSHRVAQDVWFPNGMVVLGEDTLVVAESHADRLTAWTIRDSGELADRRVWADLGPGSAPDGICADTEGAIWYASVPAQRCTRVAEGGKVLDTVSVDRGCFACMLGGDDGRRLFIVANKYSVSGASDGIVLTQSVNAPHAGRPCPSAPERLGRRPKPVVKPQAQSPTTSTATPRRATARRTYRGREARVQRRCSGLALADARTRTECSIGSRPCTPR